MSNSLQMFNFTILLNRMKDFILTNRKNSENFYEKQLRRAGADGKNMYFFNEQNPSV